MKTQLADLRAAWAKAPFSARLLAGEYIGPLFDLIEAMIQHMDGHQGAKLQPGLALDSGEFIPASELAKGGHHGN
jgi:hypothetical protein